MTDNGSFNAGVIPAIIADYVDESMWDDIGRNSAHEVHHRRREVRINTDSQGDFAIASGAGWPTGLTRYPGFEEAFNVSTSQYWLEQRIAWPMAYNATNYATPPQRWGISFPPVNESALKEDCFEKAHQLKADVLLNIVEANQIWPSITSLAGCIGNLAYNWGNIRKVVSTASGAFLAWKFGISPIISDIEAIQKYLPQMKKDIDRHVDGDLMRFSSSAKGTASIDTTVDAPDSWRRLIYQGRVNKAPLIRYVLVVKPRQSKYQTDFFKKADAVLSKFSTSPASLAWEKIPFSFVADWFVDVRGALRALDNMLGQEPFIVKSFTRSYSYHVETTLDVDHLNPCDSSTAWTRGVGTAEFKHYERTLVSEDPTWITWKPRFGKNQAGISAALISQQLSKL
jgi:hypothetical protein